MKRYLSFIVFLMFSNTAMAEWVLIGSVDEFDLYVDTTTIRKNGNLVKMWELKDYKTGQNTQDGVYLSKKVQHEYDCRNETDRLLALVAYSGNMGSGKVISSFTVNEYQSPAHPIVPGTVGVVLWKIACGQ